MAVPIMLSILAVRTIATPFRSGTLLTLVEYMLPNDAREQIDLVCFTFLKESSR